MNELHVVFRVGGAEYAIPAAEVLHMESYTGATAVPGTPSFVAGIIQVRGRVLPVVDLRARFGLPATELALDSRVVVVQVEERTVALLADSAREVVHVDPARHQPAPEMLTDGARFVRGVTYVGSRLLLLLDVARIAGEEPNDVD